jgi:hypothetical protein
MVEGYDARLPLGLDKGDECRDVLRLGLQAEARDRSRHHAGLIVVGMLIGAWLLLAIWPFTRLVHARSVPVAYIGRAPILYRSRRGTSSAGR